MPTKFSIFICTLIIFCLSILSIVPETSPAVIDADTMRFERQKLMILKGESGYRHEGVWGDGGLAYGIAQFHKRTFTAMKKMAGRPELNWKNKEDQLWLFDWAMKNGHAHNWTVARWLAASEEPAFAINQKHVFKKGSARCPTRKIVKTAAPAQEPPAPAPKPEPVQASAPAGPTFEMPLTINHADMPVYVMDI